MNSATTPTTNGNGSSAANDNHYPVFQPNQVLSNSDLNQIVSYLDSQSRLTRTRAIGMGIVCGLTIKVKQEGTNPTISLTAGCGITSAGYFVHYQPTGKTEDDTLTHFRVIELQRQKFGLTENPQDIVQVRELVTAATVQAEQQQEEDFTQLTEDNLQNQTIAILYDWDDSRRDTCLLDCDDKGQDRNFRLRFLLLDLPSSLETVSLPYLDATTLLKQGYQIPTGIELGTYFQGWYDVPNYIIKRLGYQSAADSADGTEKIDLSQIVAFDSLREAYHKVCKEAIPGISSTFTQIHKLFGPFVGGWKPDEHDFDHLQDQLTTYLNSFQSDSAESLYGIQYFYAYLVDLIAAFRELKDLLFDLMADCMPDLTRFPTYLLLGEVPLAAPAICARPSLYRHHFTQPPIYNGNAKRLQAARHLYTRLLEMSQGFALRSRSASETVKITPSRSRLAPLGEQAIPYYYSYTDLAPYWNSDACRQGRSNQLPGYDCSEAHLTDRLDWSDFFRIEGHIGKTLNTAMTAINNYRQTFNLAFDLVAVRLSEKASLGSYVKEYPGLEHLGGVPQGGTFMLVYTDKSDRVIGDFCLPYPFKPPVKPAENCFQEACLTICQGFKNQERIFAVSETRAGKTFEWDNYGRLQSKTDG
jgi:hypothetical protein